MRHGNGIVAHRLHDQPVPVLSDGEHADLSPSGQQGPSRRRSGWPHAVPFRQTSDPDQPWQRFVDRHTNHGAGSVGLHNATVRLRRFERIVAVGIGNDVMIDFQLRLVRFGVASQGGGTNDRADLRVVGRRGTTDVGH